MMIYKIYETNLYTHITSLASHEKHVGSASALDLLQRF